MKITFLGTSHGVPAADRFCSSYMIESGDAVYLVDAGAPVADLVLRQGREITDVRAIFTTHIHGDHLAGLFHITDLVNWYYKTHTMDVYIPEQACIDAIKNMILVCAPGISLHEDRLRFHLTDVTAGYTDENIRVTYFPTKHLKEPHLATSVMITENGKRILFGGDFSHRLAKQDIPQILFDEPIDAFVCEMAHFDAEDIRPYLERCKAKDVYFTHVFPLDKYEKIQAMAKELSVCIHTPNDGDQIVL